MVRVGFNRIKEVVNTGVLGYLTDCIMDGIIYPEHTTIGNLESDTFSD